MTQFKHVVAVLEVSLLLQRKQEDMPKRNNNELRILRPVLDIVGYD